MHTQMKNDKIFGSKWIIALTVQLISKLTLACTEQACVLQFLSSHTCVKHVWHETGRACAIFCALHASDICVLRDSSETAHESDFMCCTRVTLLVCCTWLIVELIPWSTYVRTLYAQVINYKMAKSMDTQKNYSVKNTRSTFTPIYSGRHYIVSLQYQTGSQMGDWWSTISNKSVTCSNRMRTCYTTKS